MTKQERLTIQIIDENLELESLWAALWPKEARLTNEICRAVTSRPMRDVLLMRYVDCMKFTDIAEVLNLSVDRVYQLFRLIH